MSEEAPGGRAALLAVGLGACCALPLLLGAGLSVAVGIAVGSGLMLLAGLLAAMLWWYRRHPDRVVSDAD